MWGPLSSLCTNLHTRRVPAIRGVNWSNGSALATGCYLYIINGREFRSSPSYRNDRSLSPQEIPSNRAREARALLGIYEGEGRPRDLHAQKVSTASPLCVRAQCLHDKPTLG